MRVLTTILALGERRARKELGQPSYFYSYMSQPKGQLKTFAKWAGVDSDIVGRAGVLG